MNDIQKIKEEIERTRKKLDGLMLGKDMEARYKTSVYLDKLIEQYLDWKERVNTK